MSEEDQSLPFEWAAEPSPFEGQSEHVVDVPFGNRSRRVDPPITEIAQEDPIGANHDEDDAEVERVRDFTRGARATPRTSGTRSESSERPKRSSDKRRPRPRSDSERQKRRARSREPRARPLLGDEPTQSQDVNPARETRQERGASLHALIAQLEQIVAQQTQSLDMLARARAVYDRAAQSGEFSAAQVEQLTHGLRQLEARAAPSAQHLKEQVAVAQSAWRSKQQLIDETHAAGLLDGTTAAEWTHTHHADGDRIDAILQKLSIE